MRIVANGALLGSGVVGNDDLTLLQWSAGHPLMAKRAQLPCVGWYHHFQIFRMIRTRRRIFEHAASIATTAGAMADLTPNDLADIRPVVDAVGPFCDLRRMA